GGHSLSPDVQHLLYFGDHLAGFIFHLDHECRLVPFLQLELFSNIVELRVGQAKFGLNSSLPGFAEADAGGLVPDNVLAAQVFHQHQHVKRIGHGVERSPIVRANIVAVPKAQLHLDIDGLVGSPAHADSGAEKWRPDVDGAKHESLQFRSHGMRRCLPQEIKCDNQEQIKCDDRPWRGLRVCVWGERTFRTPGRTNWGLGPWPVWCIPKWE